MSLQEKSRYNLSEAEGRNAGQIKTTAIPQITFIPIPRKTLQVNVKREVRDRWMEQVLKLLDIYSPRPAAKSHCEAHANFIDKHT